MENSNKREHLDPKATEGKAKFYVDELIKLRKKLIKLSKQAEREGDSFGFILVATHREDGSPKSACHASSAFSDYDSEALAGTLGQWATESPQSFNIFSSAHKDVKKYVHDNPELLLKAGLADIMPNKLAEMVFGIVDDVVQETAAEKAGSDPKDAGTADKPKKQSK